MPRRPGECLEAGAQQHFGKYGDAFSTLFDPGAMLAVTLSGQLMLIDLIERLTEAGIRVISANTDGLVHPCAAGAETTGKRS